MTENEKTKGIIALIPLHPRETCYENPAVRGSFMLRNSFGLVFLRFRVRRHHDILL
jgi:hypothetical protein